MSGEIYKYWTKKGYFETTGNLVLWDELHREDGHALELPGRIFSNDKPTYMWWINGKHHRIDGPAIIWGGDILEKTKQYEWWANGKHITNEVESWIRDNNLPHWKQWNDDIKMRFKLTWC